MTTSFLIEIGKPMRQNTRACQLRVFPPYPYFWAFVPRTPPLSMKANLFRRVNSFEPAKSTFP